MTPHDKVQQTETRPKTYKQPRLRQYGDLRSITQASGSTNRHDGGTIRGISKTS
jgi:hypothetical protein